MKFNKWFSLILVSSALFLIVIDMTVLYTALPTITYELEATAFQKIMDCKCVSVSCCRAFTWFRYVG